MTSDRQTTGPIVHALKQQHLQVIGIVAANTEDPVPPNTNSILLLGPNEPGYWQYFRAQPEYSDHRPDPMDRWSARVISTLASQFCGTAIFPFQGPPYAPFLDWALRSGRAWTSPVGMLVHDTAGLFVSFRGAICLPNKPEPQATANSPCETCDGRFCLTACPVNALTAEGYDLDACHGYLDRNSGTDCMHSGCAARRACPLSQTYGRLPAQSAHHMKAFHP